MKRTIEKYNLDDLRELVRNLEEENTKLKSLLNQNDISYDTNDVFDKPNITKVVFDDDQGSRILETEITEYLANRFFSMFWGRKDAYAKRGKNGGYYPQCRNRWLNICPKQNGDTKFPCSNCEHNQYTPLKLDDIVKHLNGYKEDGTDVIGIYPLFEDNTTRLLVFDFDYHNKDDNSEQWQNDVSTVRKICSLNNVDCLVERSRSGNGAHLWIFFDSPINASLARNFGTMLLEQGLNSINLDNFKCFDRMFPNQDSSDKLGSLIALPLQGKALKNGNSAFVDENFNAYYNQWDVLLNKTKKIKKEEIEKMMQSWSEEKFGPTNTLYQSSNIDRPKPWKRKDKFNADDVVNKLHIVLANGLYVDTLNLMPRIQNQIRCLAAFDNPEFYKNKRLGYSNYNNFSTIYLGKDCDGYIRIPRGLKETLINKCKEANIDYEIKDKQSRGKHINVTFNGDLREKQIEAIKELNKYNNGVLEAATAFGKTVVCSYLISQKKTSTFIILNNISLQEQWYKEIKNFLTINEQPPKYKTKNGERTRKDVIGFLNGSKNTLTGIIDIVSIQSLVNYEEDIFDNYGMVLIDECQYSASSTYIKVLNKIKSKYVFGVSATPQRGDHLEKIFYMMIGPIRHTYSSKQRALDQGIKHYFVPRFTRVTNITGTDDINELYSLVCNNKERNEQIVFDIKECIKNKKTIMVLGKYKEHVKYIYEQVKDVADNVFLIYGDKSQKENKEEIEKLTSVKDDESIIIVSTMQKLGEGFNYPRLDTLMLIAPVSDPSKHEQYVGRLNRDYPGKEEVYVYDYVDWHIKIFAKQYHKRINNYKRLEYYIYNGEIKEKTVTNLIHNVDDYVETFENDLIEANKLIVISSPNLSNNKIQRLLSLIKNKQENGVKATVITKNPETDNFNDPNIAYSLIYNLKEKGINVIIKDEIDESYAVIDDLIVWYGGISLLGKETLWNNLIRLEDEKLAIELLETSTK